MADFVVAALVASGLGAIASITRYPNGSAEQKRVLRWLAAGSVLSAGYVMVCLALDLMTSAPQPLVDWVAAGLVFVPVCMVLAHLVPGTRASAVVLVEAIASNRLADEAVSGIVINARDVGERKALLDQLAHQAFHDPLTGLANRALFYDRVSHALQLSQRESRTVTVLFLDLDGFKQVNDTWGHAEGDHLLRMIANRLRACARATDTVARLGGDEFAVVLRGIAGPVQAEWQVRDLLAALEPPCTLDGIAVEVHGSVGVAVAPDHGTEVAELLKKADIAMYAAKAHGRGVQGYEAALRAAGPNHLSLGGELRSAIATDQLVTHVQPQACLTTGKLLAAEALVRWEHPRHGLLAPDDFIALAERTGLIKPLTLAVLDRALAANAEWRATGADLRISVNMSARSLTEPVLVAEIAGLLQRHGVPATSLTLEITESTVVKEAGRSVEVLHRLAAMGVRISIDDFGTGQSALAYLRRLPISEIKIDKSFVIGMDDNLDNAAIVRAVVDLGARLDIDVVAEGVEERPVWDRLAGFGATCAQGYFVARPMPLAEFPAWLATYDPRRQLRWEGKGRGAA